MTKTELVRNLADRSGLTKAQAGSALDTLLGIIEGELAAGGKVTLTGFGTFSVSHREARSTRNPATGGMVQVPERDVPRFKAGALLKAGLR